MTPSAVDLRPAVDKVYDQGYKLGTCFAFGAKEAMETLYERAGQPIKLSALDINYRSRKLAFTLPQQGISDLSYVGQALRTEGICLDSLWPYVEATENNPPDGLDEDAATHKAISVATLGPVGNYMPTVKKWLSKGVPIIYMVQITNDFYLAGLRCHNWREFSWDNIPSDTNPVIGVHVMTAQGYDDSCNRILIQNSWGPTWGDGGFCAFPYSGGFQVYQQSLVISELQVPIVNAGYREDGPLFDQLMDVAEARNLLPKALYPTAEFTSQSNSHYFYRVYSDGVGGVVYYGLDTSAQNIVRFVAGEWPPVNWGSFEFWLQQAGL